MNLRKSTERKMVAMFLETNIYWTILTYSCKLANSIQFKYNPLKKEKKKKLAKLDREITITIHSKFIAQNCKRSKTIQFYSIGNESKWIEMNVNSCLSEFLYQCSMLNILKSHNIMSFVVLSFKNMLYK